MFDEALQIRDRLAVLVDRLDPDAVSGSTARELWSALDQIERLGAAGKTLLARRVAATHQRNGGTRSAAEELARRSGTSAGVAKDALTTSQRLPDQPGVDGALRRGELSPVQTALISAAVAADPSQAERLTELAAKVSLPELREECARVTAGADPDPAATNRRLHESRRLRRYIDSEGFWNLHAKGTPQAGAAFCAVLDALTDQRFQQARRDGRKELLEAYAFDALMTMADRAADPNPHRPAAAAHTSAPSGDGPGPTNRDDPDSTGGTPPAIPSAPPAMSRGRPNPRYLALLRVDLQALRRGRVDDDEVCEIHGVGPVPVSVAEGLPGQAVLELVITRGVDVLNVTHLGRGPTAAERIALAWASPGCTVQGCWRSRTENDHRQPWAESRHTRLDELDPLCHHHHDLIPGTAGR
jgi:Domain of unknown function (DUF222)